MKNYKEMSDSVLKRIDEYNREKEIKHKRIKRVATPAVIFVFVFLGLGLWKSGVIHKAFGTPELAVKTETITRNENGFEVSSQIDENISEGDRDNTVIATTAVIENGQEGHDESDVEITDNDKHIEETLTSQANQGDHRSGAEIYGGNTGNWWNIPALPFDRRIDVVGEELTDEEAQEYFKENIAGISRSLSASGVTVEDLTIMPKGYCHVSYSGVEGKPFELKQNFRDYLAYNGDKLTAIITLVKENGKISDTPSFGAAWFDNFNAALQQHKGEKLVFVYASFMEVVVTPDNRYFSPMGIELGLDFESYNNDIYNMFYHEKAVYVP